MKSKSLDEELQEQAKGRPLLGLSQELINDELKTHATGLKEDQWEFSEHECLLHEWAERFSVEFKLNIPTPAIQIDELSRRTLGTYLPGRNGFGLRNEITFNSRHFNKPIADLLNTCCHELLHEWQEIHGNPGRSKKRYYHNNQFREKAKSLGLLIDKWGRDIGVVPGPFTKLLEKHGIDTSYLPKPGENSTEEKFPGNTPRTKMKKWECACFPNPKRIRAAVDLNILCLDCNHIFEKKEF